MHKYLIALAKKKDPVTIIVTATASGIREQQQYMSLQDSEPLLATLQKTIIYIQGNLKKSQFQ